MLKTAPVSPTLPSTDLKRSRDFYVDKLGLSVKKETEGSLTFEAGGGTLLYVYKRPPAPSEHTLASFQVGSVEEAVDALSANGVEFEHYDFPGLKTNEKGIAVSEEEGEKAAWFKDPDGNILAIAQEV